MQPADAVTRYFSEAAAGYREGPAGAVFDLVRAAEARAVEALLGEVEGARVLELGCGDGHYAGRLTARGAAVTAVDLVPAMVDRARARGIDARVGDAATIDLGARFPRLLCAGVLEFVADPAAVLANARRHATDGGRLVLLVPSDTVPGRLYQRWHASHDLPVRLFDRSALGALAAATGWTLTAVRRAGLFATVARLEAT